mmetsp:Transcript_28607/g.98780  ORF Transcript_28607/g.98780 Transcript_28607/m.98780 type:complete len:273 (-) Transcript_28607:331-1149(-)
MAAAGGAGSRGGRGGGGGSGSGGGSGGSGGGRRTGPGVAGSMGASPAAACVAATIAFVRDGPPRDGTAVASILKTGGGLTAAAGDAAATVDGVVSGVAACHAALRIMSVTPCKASAEGWDSVFLTELYHCGNHKAGTFKAAVFQRSGRASAVACLFPDDFGDKHRVFAFDPTPHPELGLNGPSFLTFTSLRGLQLHLKRVLGDGDGDDAAAAEAATVALASLRPPREPKPEECCGNSCPNCVWTQYWVQLQDYERELKRLKALGGVVQEEGG